jgi:hypothetical protein
MPSASEPEIAAIRVPVRAQARESEIGSTEKSPGLSLVKKAGVNPAEKVAIGCSPEGGVSAAAGCAAAGASMPPA